MNSLIYVFQSILWRRLTSLFLLGVIFFLWLMLGGLILAGVGAPFQFWHDDFIKRIIAELTVGGFVGVWTLTCFLVDHGKPHEIRPNVFGVKIPNEFSFMDKDLTGYFWSGIKAQAKVGYTLCVIMGIAGFFFAANVELSNNFHSPIMFVFFGTTWISLGFTLFLLTQLAAFRFLIHKFGPSLLGRFFGWVSDRMDSLFMRTWNSDSGTRLEPAMEQLFHRIAFYTQFGLSAILFIRVLTYWIGSLLTPSFILVQVDLTAGAYICITLSIMTGFYGYLIYQRRLHHSSRVARNSFQTVQLAIIVVALIFVFIPLDSQPVRNLRDPAFNTIEEWLASDKTAENTKQGLPTEFETNDEQLKKRPLVIIANSGGGIKAQIWSTIVLNAIEQRVYQERQKLGSERDADIAQHVRFITGTSGGMVGAAYWTATLGPPELSRKSEHLGSHWMYTNNNLDGAKELSAEQMISQMCADGLTPVARQGFSNDFLGAPYNFAVERLEGINSSFGGLKLDSRGRALEYTWESPYWFDASIASGHSAFAQNFRELAKFEKQEGFEANVRLRGDGTKVLPTDQKWRPSLMMAPAVAENGRRFLISNADVDYLLVSEIGEGQRSVSGYSWKSFFPEDDSREDGFKLSTAARLNANFPVIIDSPTLPLNPKLHLMDAGYYDNFGVTLATEWLVRNREMIKKMYSGVLFIQIAAAPLSRAVNGVDKTAPFPELPGFVTSSFNKTIYNTDSMIAQLNLAFNELPQIAKSASQTEPVFPVQDPDVQNPDDFFQFVSFEYAGPASLSWYVSRTEIYSLLYPLLSKQQVQEAMDRSEVNEQTREFVDGTLVIGGNDDLFSVDNFPQVFREDVFERTSTFEKPGEYIFFRQLNSEIGKSAGRPEKKTIGYKFQTIKDKWLKEQGGRSSVMSPDEEREMILDQTKKIRRILSQNSITDSKKETRLQQLVLSRIEIQNHLNLVANWWAKKVAEGNR